MGEVKFMISEAAKKLQVEAHVLRYWEEELGLHIERTEMGHRYYTEDDIQLFQCIQKLKNEGILLRELKTLIPQLTELRRKKTEAKNAVKKEEGTSPSHADLSEAKQTPSAHAHGTGNRQNHADVALARYTKDTNSSGKVESVLAELTKAPTSAAPDAATAKASAKPVSTVGQESASAATIATASRNSDKPTSAAFSIGVTETSSRPASVALADSAPADVAPSGAAAPAPADPVDAILAATADSTLASSADSFPAVPADSAPVPADPTPAATAGAALAVSSESSPAAATPKTADAATAEVIEVTHLEQVRALFGDVITEAITANNHTLEKNISRRVTSNVCREIDLLFQAQEHQEEEHYRKLDTLIRQQQAFRREAAENAPVGAFKKLFT